MASETIIPVPFKPLLVHACEALGLPSPLYACCDSATNNYSVVVMLNSEPATYKLSGGPAQTMDESCERATRKMVLHLMTAHGLCVYGVNLPRKEEADRCLALFALKRAYYMSMEQGALPLPLSTAFPKEQIHSDTNCIRIDFYPVLGDIIERFGVHVTRIEYFQLDTFDHVAWLIVTCPGKVFDAEVIVSERCASAFDAKQSVSEKTIQFLMPIYNFLVEDANFHLLPRSVLSLKLERETYFTVKERVYGYVVSNQPQPFLDEELPCTPRGPTFRIPEGPPPLVPPKKRLPRASLAGASYVDTLDFFQHAKRPRIE